jgi:hypothetical protein
MLLQVEIPEQLMVEQDRKQARKIALQAESISRHNALYRSQIRIIRILEK